MANSPGKYYQSMPSAPEQRPYLSRFRDLVVGERHVSTGRHVLVHPQAFFGTGGEGGILGDFNPQAIFAEPPDQPVDLDDELPWELRED